VLGVGLQFPCVGLMSPCPPCIELWSERSVGSCRYWHYRPSEKNMLLLDIAAWIMPHWSARRNSGSPVVEELYLKRLYRGLHGSLLRPVPAPLLINRTRTGAGSQVLHGSLKITRSRDQHRTIIQQIDACWALVRQQTSEQNGVLLGPSPAPTTGRRAAFRTAAGGRVAAARRRAARA